MKNIYFLLATLIFIGQNLFADPIDQQTAQKVAVNFYLTRPAAQSLGNNLTAILQHREEINLLNNQVSQIPTTLYYIFNIDNKGFVIVAGDDQVKPVIGYSTEGVFPTSEMPIQVSMWFKKYENEIKFILENKINSSADIKNEWHNLLKGTNYFPDYSILGVNPLVHTKWNQYPYYNDLCPGGSITGCVATAMAQIMKYWNYPIHGIGSHSYYEDDYGWLYADFGNTTYDWASMPNVLSGPNYEVARLMYHCGVAVEMNYDLASNGGSGAYMSNVGIALQTYFSYSTSVQEVFRANYFDSDWIALIKSELDAGRPVNYAGNRIGAGHSFICDGYDNYDYFHFNWGWGGQFDAYFYLDDLNPKGSGGYNYDQEAIVGIQPNSGSGPSNTNIDLYSSIIVSPDPIQYNKGFIVHTDLTNTGTSTFYGDIAAALFDEAGTFIDFIQNLTESKGLMPNYHYTYGLDFETNGISAPPGNYQICIYVNPGSGWIAVGNGIYSNCIPVSIEGNNKKADVNGTIKTEDGRLTSKVQVALNSNNVIVGQSLTDISGSYLFSDLPLNTGYSILANRNDDPTNGITTADIVKIQRHILGIEALNSPYKLIAADVNKSNSITAADIAEIRKLILGIKSEFAKVPSWVMIPSDVNFNNPKQPWNYNLEEDFTTITQSSKVDFIAIKMGDVTNSAKADNFNEGQVNRSASSLNFYIDNTETTLDNFVVLHFKSNDFNNIIGFQFTLNFDSGNLEFNGFESKSLELDESLFGLNHLNKGLLTMSWDAHKGFTFSGDDELFTLKFSVIGSAKTINPFAITNDITKAEAYSENLEIKSVKLNITSDKEAEETGKIELYQNTPNPFNNETMISFNIDEEINVNLIIMDANGKIINQSQLKAQKGLNTVYINHSVLRSPGMYYYQVNSGKHFASRRMIVIE